MNTNSDLYSTNILRKYGDGKNNEYKKKEREIPSEHKMSLLKTLPVDLDGPYPATIFINERCDIIFKTERGTCYYSDVQNKILNKFKLK